MYTDLEINLEIRVYNQGILWLLMDIKVLE